MIELYIENLLNYGETHGLFDRADRIYIRNEFIDVLSLDDYCLPASIAELELSEILSKLLDYAIEQGIIENTITQRDLFDTKLMGLMTPRPSAVINKFWSEFSISPEGATDYYYDFSMATNYIRTDRLKNDLKWTTDTEYGTLDVSINLSKPEKDPNDIAAEKTAPAKGYPKCALCIENEGYHGSIHQAARQNHRIIPITLNGETWYFQYSPYVYYNEHCIVIEKDHHPMKTTKETFIQMFDFVELFPHYFIGANADIPIVGGSILSHNHFQGGRCQFPMMRAKIKRTFSIVGFNEVSVGILNWPVTTLRLIGENRDSMIDLANHIFNKWLSFSCEQAGIFAFTNGERHNAVTPILRKEGNCFILDLALRNNITSEERPLGVFHPRPDFHHIKKENIGLIEVMGLAILPARLKSELEAVKDSLLSGKKLSENSFISKHRLWAEEIERKHTHIDEENVDDILKNEVGLVFKQVLEDTGVFKPDEMGYKNLTDFISTL